MRQRHAWRWAVGLGLLATAWVVVGVRSAEEAEPHGPGGVAPAVHVAGNQVTYELPLVSGTWRSSREDQGLAVVICFWAPWCDPCMAVLSWLEQYWQTLDGQPVAVLAVGVETDAQSIQASGVRLPVALLPALSAPSEVPLDRLPLIWLVSPEGQLVWKGEGYGSRLRLASKLAGYFRPRAAEAASPGEAGKRP